MRTGSPGRDPLREDDAEIYVASTCFKTGPPGRVGVELEWLVVDARDPRRIVDPDRVETALTGVQPLPGRGWLSTEPGGQLELSTACAASLSACLVAANRDLARIRSALGAAGLRIRGDGRDPVRPPRRVLDLPRYVAMERFFDRSGPEGRVMMCSTASVQVSVDAGPEFASPGAAGDFRRRWALLHSIAPVLVAIFANSPFAEGAPTGLRSSRHAVWTRLDASRTAPPPNATDPAADPRAEYARYALDARLLCIPNRSGESPHGDPPPGLTFRQWLRDGGRTLRRPTRSDLDFHLSTLFPPVRPRGWYELRVVDAQPAASWPVVAALVCGLVEDQRATEAAFAATEPLWAGSTGSAGSAGSTGSTSRRMGQAASHRAVSEPVLGKAARACVAAAIDALPRLGVNGGLQRRVIGWAERFTERLCCPADDRLDRFRRTGEAGWSRDDEQDGEHEQARDEERGTRWSA
jgi:glutamate--cysteine ligase